MGQKIRDVMTAEPVTIESDRSVFEAAKAMRDYDVGDVLVLEGGRLYGLMTDRDVVVRVLAAGLDAMATRVSEVCSRDMVAVSADDDTSHALRLVRGRSVRRIPVLRDGVPVGIVTIGDLAFERDGMSQSAGVPAARRNTES